jgi:hypothetical protein
MDIISNICAVNAPCSRCDILIFYPVIQFAKELT